MAACLIEQHAQTGKTFINMYVYYKYSAADTNFVVECKLSPYI